MTVHGFTRSLDWAAHHADAPWWEEAYRAAFPGLVSLAVVRDDGWAQRGGIDRVLTLGSGKTLTIDEKVRDRDYGDFLIEYWSDARRRVPGWAVNDAACDYIAYAFVPSGRCYLLPFQELRRATVERGREWVERYREPQHVAYNRQSGRRWETHFVPVPIPVVLSAITDAMLVRFTPPGELDIHEGARK